MLRFSVGIIPALAGNTTSILRSLSSYWDHPRACGEHIAHADCVEHIQGSSPRLRGTLPRTLGLQLGQGIIPALAGNTGLPHSLCRLLRDHPRACGEHLAREVRVYRATGSSPRLRGTRTRFRYRRTGHGIIPALAENTSMAAASRSARWDHPRACGEHDGSASASCWRLGSSPRLRGTRRTTPCPTTACGIIPALAGNTWCRGMRLRPTRDHPRACGEHYCIVCVIRVETGSSPRLRGTPDNRARSVPSGGIIPALAGNTKGHKRRLGLQRDHPRACGEHVIPWRRENAVLGSSPRLRGTPVCFDCLPLHFGIIPALAGNTFRPDRIRGCPRDHPRACGEHFHRNNQWEILQGSSPRLRGTQDGRAESWIRVGIIPALAGNTMVLSSMDRWYWDHPRACGEHTGSFHGAARTPGSSPRLRGTQFISYLPYFLPGIIPALAGNTSRVKFACTVARDHPRACGEHYGRTAYHPRCSGSSPRLRGTLAVAVNA